MNHLCNKKELTVFLPNDLDQLSWTVQADGKYEFKGVEGRYLSMLIDYLGIPANFISTEYGKLMEHQANGSLDMAMVVGEFNMAPAAQMSFSTPNRVNYVTFASRKSVPLSTRFAFLYPFTLDTWLGFIFVCILFSVIAIFLMKKKISYLDLCFQILGCFFRQAYQVSVKPAKIRVLFLFWVFFTMVVSFSHSAVFFSFMVNPLKDPAVRNFKELSSAVVAGRQKLYIYESYYVIKSLTVTNEVYMWRLFNIVRENLFTIWYRNEEDFEENAIIRNDIIVRDSLALQLKFGMNSEVYISDDIRYHFFVSSFLFGKNFCFKKEVDIFNKRALGAGLYQKILKDEQMKLNRFSRVTPAGNVIRPLSLYDICGILIVFTAGLIISFLAFVLEVATVKYFRN